MMELLPWSASVALIWNITFPNGVFSSTDTLIRKSKVKNAYVR